MLFFHGAYVTEIYYNSSDRATWNKDQMLFIIYSLQNIKGSYRKTELAKVSDFN